MVMTDTSMPFPNGEPMFAFDPEMCLIDLDTGAPTVLVTTSHTPADSESGQGDVMATNTVDTAHATTDTVELASAVQDIVASEKAKGNTNADLLLHAIATVARKKSVEYNDVLMAVFAAGRMQAQIDSK